MRSVSIRTAVVLGPAVVLAAMVLAGLAAPARAAPTEWSPSAGGIWGNSANWTAGVIPDGNTETALLGTHLLVDGSVIDLVATSRTIKDLIFQNTLASYQIGSTGGGTLILAADAGHAAITFDPANTRNHSISAPLNLASSTDLTLGSNTLTLLGPQTWSAGKTLTVLSGTLTYNTSSPSSVGAGAALVINPAATVNVGGTADPLSGGSSVSVINHSTSGLNVSSGNKTIASLSGSGNTGISPSAALAVPGAISQNQLMIDGSLTAGWTIHAATLLNIGATGSLYGTAGYGSYTGTVTTPSMTVAGGGYAYVGGFSGLSSLTVSGALNVNSDFAVSGATTLGNVIDAGNLQTSANHALTTGTLTINRGSVWLDNGALTVANGITVGTSITSGNLTAGATTAASLTLPGGVTNSAILASFNGPTGSNPTVAVGAGTYLSVQGNVGDSTPLANLSVDGGLNVGGTLAVKPGATLQINSGGALYGYGGSGNYTDTVTTPSMTVAAGGNAYVGGFSGLGALTVNSTLYVNSSFVVAGVTTVGNATDSGTLQTSANRSLSTDTLTINKGSVALGSGALAVTNAITVGTSSTLASLTAGPTTAASLAVVNSNIVGGVNLASFNGPVGSNPTVAVAAGARLLVMTNVGDSTPLSSSSINGDWRVGGSLTMKPGSTLQINSGGGLYGAAGSGSYTGTLTAPSVTVAAGGNAYIGGFSGLDALTVNGTIYVNRDFTAGGTTAVGNATDSGNLQTIANHSLSTATLTITKGNVSLGSGALAVTNGITVGASGKQGTLTAGSVSAASLTLASGSTATIGSFSGTGDLTVNGTFSANGDVAVGGTTTVGNDTNPGTLQVSADHALTTNTLTIHRGSASLGGSALAVTNEITVGTDSTPGSLTAGATTAASLTLAPGVNNTATLASFNGPPGSNPAVEVDAGAKLTVSGNVGDSTPLASLTLDGTMYASGTLGIQPGGTLQISTGGGLYGSTTSNYTGTVTAAALTVDNGGTARIGGFNALSTLNVNGSLYVNSNFAVGGATTVGNATDSGTLQTPGNHSFSADSLTINRGSVSLGSGALTVTNGVAVGTSSAPASLTTGAATAASLTLSGTNNGATLASFNGPTGSNPTLAVGAGTSLTVQGNVGSSTPLASLIVDGVMSVGGTLGIKPGGTFQVNNGGWLYGLSGSGSYTGTVTTQNMTMVGGYAYVGGFSGLSTLAVNGALYVNADFAVSGATTVGNATDSGGLQVNTSHSLTTDTLTIHCGGATLGNGALTATNGITVGTGSALAFLAAGATTAPSLTLSGVNNNATLTSFNGPPASNPTVALGAGTYLTVWGNMGDSTPLAGLSVDGMLNLVGTLAVKPGGTLQINSGGGLYGYGGYGNYTGTVTAPSMTVAAGTYAFISGFSGLSTLGVNGGLYVNSNLAVGGTATVGNATDSGTLQTSANHSLSADTLTINKGSVSLGSGPLAVTNAVTVGTSSTPGSLTAGTTTAGSLTLPGGASNSATLASLNGPPGSNPTVAVGAGTSLTVWGNVGNSTPLASLVINGGMAVGGALAVKPGGTLQVNNGGTLNGSSGSWDYTGAVTAPAMTVAGTGSARIGGFSGLSALTVNGALYVNGNSAVSGTTLIDGSGTSTLAGALSIGPGGILEKTGSGTLSILGICTQTHALGALLKADAGIINVSSSTGAELTANASGGTLNFNDVTQTLGGLGLSNGGHVHANMNLAAGATTVGSGGGTLLVDAGRTVTTSGLSMADGATLVKTGTGTLIISGPQSYGTGAVLQFGSTGSASPQSEASQTVPEPASWALLAMGAATLLLLRRRFCRAAK